MMVYHVNKVVVFLFFCAQSKSAASSMREWTEQETLLLLEVQTALKMKHKDHKSSASNSFCKLENNNPGM